jgi:hypothetical protein
MVLDAKEAKSRASHQPSPATTSRHAAVGGGEKKEKKEKEEGEMEDEDKPASSSAHTQRKVAADDEEYVFEFAHSHSRLSFFWPVVRVCGRSSAHFCF